MRECGVRGFLICYGDCHRSHPVAVSGDRRLDDVRLSDLGCGSPAGPAAGAAWMCGGFPLERRGPTCNDFRTTHVEPDLTAWIRTRGKVESSLREIRGKNARKRRPTG